MLLETVSREQCNFKQILGDDENPDALFLKSNSFIYILQSLLSLQCFIFSFLIFLNPVHFASVIFHAV